MQRTESESIMAVTGGQGLATFIVASLMFFIGFTGDTEVALEVASRSPDREAFAWTLGMTLVGVPTLTVLALQSAPDIPPAGVLGVFIVSLLPGGPAANVIAICSHANRELNMCLTIIEQSLSLIMLTVGLLFVYPVAFDASQRFALPFGDLVGSLSSTVVPMLAGMLVSHGWSRSAWVQSRSEDQKQWITRMSRITAVVAFAVVGTGLLLQRLQGEGGSYSIDDLTQMVTDWVPTPTTLLAACLFALACILCAAAVALMLPGQPLANRKSIVLEIGIRDFSLAFPLITLGLPHLPLAEQGKILLAAAVAAVVANSGVILCAFATARICCVSEGTRERLPPPPTPAKLHNRSETLV